MSRLGLFLVLVVGIVGGGLAATLLRPDEAKVRAIAAEVVAATPAPPAGLDQSAVERIVAELLAKQKAEQPPQSEAALDAARLNPMIEDYLLGNPHILQQVSAALEAELTAAKKAETSAALAELGPAIYEDPRQIVLGNPNGDVTLVEMFDYNCGYCRQALPDIARLLDEDPNLKIVLKEFPILSQNSVDAARIAVQVADADVDYWTFHQALFTGRGQVDKAAALKAAADLGLNPVALELNMNAPDVAGQIEMTYRIAQRLDISGTPTFIIGDEVIPGAIGIDQLRLRINNLRACGSTACPAG